MRKEYLIPATAIATTEVQPLLRGSVRSDIGIDYGGVDEEGTKEPASRQHKSVWDDEDEEDRY